MGRYNITVNAICPGDPDGERNLEVARDKAKNLGARCDNYEYWEQNDKMGQKGVLAGRYLTSEVFVATPTKHNDRGSQHSF